MGQTTTTPRYRVPLARLAAGTLLASSLALTAATGVASAETPPSGLVSTGLGFVETPASGAASAALTGDHHGRKDRKKYLRGRRDGFKQGIRDGHRHGLQQCAWPFRVQGGTDQDAYSRGFEAGYAKGYLIGFAAHCRP